MYRVACVCVCVEIVIHDVLTTSHVFKINGIIFFNIWSLRYKGQNMRLSQECAPTAVCVYFVIIYYYIKSLMVDKYFPEYVLFNLSRGPKR